MKNTEGYRKDAWEEKWGALMELVNLPDSTKAKDKFSHEHPFYTGQFSIPLAQTLLQQAWHDRKAANRAATMLLSGQVASSTISDSIQKAIASGAEPPMKGDEALFLSPIHVDWLRGELVHKWQSPLEQDFYALLKLSDHALICKRYGRGCPTPYFIAKKLPRNYCGEECSQKAQQESKEKYEKQRQARKKKQPKGKGKR